MVQYIGNTMLVSGYRLALGLTSFQRAAGRPLETLRGPVDPTQQQPSKPHFNFSLGQGIESHRPSSQTATDRNLCSLPIDLALLVDPLAIHPWISDVLGGSGVSPCRALVNLRRTFHARGPAGRSWLNSSCHRSNASCSAGHEVPAPGQCPGAFFHARHCLADVPDAPVPNQLPRPATIPKAGSAQKAPASVQRALRCRCGSLQASHNVKQTFKTQTQTSPSGCWANAATPKRNGCTHPSPSRVRSVDALDHTTSP